MCLIVSAVRSLHERPGRELLTRCMTAVLYATSRGLEIFFLELYPNRYQGYDVDEIWTKMFRCLYSKWKPNLLYADFAKISIAIPCGSDETFTPVKWANYFSSAYYLMLQQKERIDLFVYFPLRTGGFSRIQQDFRNPISRFYQIQITSKSCCLLRISGEWWSRMKLLSRKVVKTGKPWHSVISKTSKQRI